MLAIQRIDDHGQAVSPMFVKEIQRGCTYNGRVRVLTVSLSLTLYLSISKS
jgi:hypothetical protein